MADRLSAYADWLVANQNQRGTPEFDTVANAYRQLRQQGPRDGALAFSVDQAQRMAGKGIEAVGNLVGSQGIADVGTGIVEQQQRDIAAGGYQPQFGGSLSSYIGTENFFPALGEKVLENLAPGGAAIVGTGAATVAALMGAPITALGIGGATLGGSVLLETGASAEEQEERTGDYDPATAAAVGVVAGILDKVGAGKVIPKDKLAKMTVGQVAEELAKKGKTKAARDFVAQVARSARGEGLTEVAQEGLQVAGAMTQGGDYTAQELVERGADAFMLGGTLGGGTRAAIDTAGAILPTGTQATDPEGAADLARRLQTIAQENGLNLNDIDKTSTKGAREAVDKAHVQLAEELKQTGRDLRQRLGITDTDELSVVLDKVLAAAGQREARNKTKNTVGKQEFDAIERLTGDTAEGQQMLRLMRQMNELTELHNSGYQGGVSRITDQFMPFGTNIGYDRGAIATERLLRPLVSGGAAVQTGGASLVGQTALAGAGRAIDAVTGRRSRVKRFIQQNAAKPGVQVDPSATSLRDERKQQVLAAQQQAAQDQQRRDAARARTRAMHRDILNSNTEYPQGSPQQIMINELGLSPQQLIRALKSIVTDPTYGPAARSAIRSLQRGGRIQNVGLLIKRLQREMAKTTPPATRDRPIVPGQLAVYEAQEQQRSAAVAQGIRDNQALNDQLQAALEADTTVSEGDRQIAKSTLEKLRMDLTRAPLETAEAYLQDALNRASDPGVITKYVLPYVERVRVQQNARAASEAPTANEAMSAEPEINQMAVPDFGQGQSIFPVPPKLTERVIGVTMEEGDYRAMPQNESVTGQTFDGSRVYIDNDTGRGGMEVDADQRQDAEPSRELGRRFRTNLVKKHVVNENGNIGLRIWSWVEQPEGNTRSKDDQESLVAFEQGKDHFYTLNLEMNVPTELAKDQGNINAGNQPYLRPRGFGQPTLGKKVGSIRTSQGKVHPVYDTIRVEPKDAPEINQMSPTFEGVNDPMRISPRKPTGANATEDALAEDLQIDAASLLNSPRLGDKVRGIVDGYVGLQGSRREGDTRPPEARFIEHVKSNLLHLYNAVSPEYRERAKQWYVGANKLSSEAATRFDLTLPQVSGVMAALSPQKDWYMNYDLGVRTIDVFMNAQDQVFSPEMAEQMRAMIKKQSAAQQPILTATLKDIEGKKLKDLSIDDQAIFVRFYDQANNPERGHRVISPEGDLLDFQRKKDGTKSGTAWNGFRDIAKAISIIQNGSRENISEQLGDMHKVRSFYNNILNPMSDRGDVTIDTHAVAAGMMKPLSGKALEVGHNFNTAGKSAITGAKGTYGLYAEAYRQAAAEVGVLPREMQSITWEAVRGLFSPQFKGQQPNVDAIENIWKRYDEGTISIEQAREEIFDVAGNIDSAAWETGPQRSDSAIDPKAGLSGNAGELPGAGVSGRGDDTGAPGQPAGILYQSPIDFDGAGDNGQLGRAPGLAASPIVGSREPTPTEVEQASRTVKAAFEIGKPGSEFENGVPDIDAAKKIAEAINVAVIVADTHGKLASRAGKAVNRKIKPSDVKGSAGFFVPNVRGPAYARGAIGVNTSESSPSYQLYTALHELGHAFETRFANTVDTDLKKVEDQIYSLNRAKFIELDAKSKRETYANTFRDVMRQVLAVAGGGDADLKISQQDAQEIVAEIVAMQRAGQVGGESIRQDYGRGRQLVALGAYTQGEVDSVIRRGETNYFHTPWELAADAIGIYFHSPEVAKQEMPKTARLLQIAFRDNPTIQFFSLPFASIVAMVLANMLVAEGEEEEDMDPGALSMGAGALTA